MLFLPLCLAILSPLTTSARASKELHGTFDYFIAGPPYVSMDCISEYEKAFEVLGRTPNTPCSIVIGATLEEPMQEVRMKFCEPTVRTR